MSFYEMFHLRNWSFIVLLISLLIPSVLMVIAIAMKEKHPDDPTKKRFTTTGIILIVFTSLYILFMIFLLYCRANLHAKASYLRGLIE